MVFIKEGLGTVTEVILLVIVRRPWLPCLLCRGGSKRTTTWALPAPLLLVLLSLWEVRHLPCALPSSVLPCSCLAELVL